MIGTNPNLTLPSGSDTMATVVAKIATALSTLATSIADKATPAAFNINQALSLAGNALTDCSTITLVRGNISTTPGSMYYGTDGEFYAVDVTGTAVKLTANGQINIGGTGGFVGDYVSSNSTGAAYDSASGQFRFTKAAGAQWADVVAANVVHQGSAGSVKIGVDAAINTARIFNFKSLPAAGVSLLVYNAATSTLEDANVTAPTNAVVSVNVGTLTTTVDEKHTNVWSGPIQMTPSQGSTNFTAGDVFGISTGTGWGYHTPTILLRHGDRIKTYTIYTSTGLGSVQVTLWKRFLGSAVAVDGPHTFNFSGANGYSQTIGTPVAISPGEHWWLQFSAGSANGETIDALTVSWDRP